tara:strand:+ start:52 stop:393 length:342 start_codon:yes stop_codon:yes gene_type:complete
MSNERIDLTQFEGATEGPWNMDELGEIWRAVPLDAEPYCVMSFYHHPSIKPSEADLRLMAAGPALVAELKRCYEELDRPKVTIDDWDKAGPCVTVYLEGKQYVGILREYDASE